LEKCLQQIDEIIGQTRGQAQDVMSTSKPSVLEFAAMLVKVRTLNRMNEFRKAFTLLRAIEGRIHALPDALQAEFYFSWGKVCTGYGIQDEVKRLPAEAWYLEALRRFSRADSIGHASITFRISCKLQIADLQLKLDRVVDAKRTLGDVAQLLGEIEPTFLSSRYEKLKSRSESTGAFYCKFSEKFDLVQARKKLEQAYLDNLADRSGVEPGEFGDRYGELKSLIPENMTKSKLLGLVTRHRKP
jgi:hypothetical protein